MKVWRKQTVRWRLNGRNVSKGTPHAKRHVIESKRFYGTLRDANGKRQQVPLSEDKDASLTLLRRLQTEADRDKALGVPVHVRDARRPIEEFLTQYEKHLANKGNVKRHVAQTMSYIRKLLTSTKTKTLQDINAQSISNTLAAWRSRSKRPIGVRTSNYHARAIKGFTRWLWTEAKTPDDMLRSLRLHNAKADVRRQRRAFTVDELSLLIETTNAQRKMLYGLSPTDRAMLYVVAAYTGLRASELASLTLSSFDLQAKTVTVEAGYSKRRRQDTLPLHPSIVERLTPYLASKESGKVWRGAWNEKGAKMIRHDLKRCDIACVDDKGRVLDFHALRHTFISSLARAGVHPSKAKELARHSTITLTMDIYSHVEDSELRQALDALPTLDNPRSKSA